MELREVLDFPDRGRGGPLPAADRAGGARSHRRHRGEPSGLRSVVDISDGADPRLDGYRHLKDAPRRAVIDRDAGVFVVEGALAVRQLIASRWPADSLLLSRSRAAALPDLVAAAGAAGVAVYTAPREVLAEVAGFAFHRGVLALGRRLPEPEAPVWPGARLIAVVEGVNDHENLGALFRNASAFDLGAVLLDPTTADPLYRRAIRVSVGHVLRVPFARLAPWPQELETIRDAGFTLVALTPGGDETVDRAARALSGRRVATLVGAEGPGLSAAAMAHADRRVRIPLAADVDSLNVATAAAVAWHRLCELP